MARVKFRCQYCHSEVVADSYSSRSMVGNYAECPECEAENPVELEEKVAMDSWQEDEKEEIEDALSGNQ